MIVAAEMKGTSSIFGGLSGFIRDRVAEARLGAVETMQWGTPGGVPY